jgi:excisionase family DNA binding protein
MRREGKRMNSGEWLSVSQIARELGRDPRTVRNWCKNNQLPAKKIGGQWMSRRSWLDDWIDAQTLRARNGTDG